MTELPSDMVASHPNQWYVASVQYSKLKAGVPLSNVTNTSGFTPGNSTATADDGYTGSSNSSVTADGTSTENNISSSPAMIYLSDTTAATISAETNTTTETDPST